MIAEYQKKSNIGVGVGFVLEVAGQLTVGQEPALQASPSVHLALTIVGSICMVVGAVLFIWGCVQYCLAKGYSGWLGLLGLMSCFGLVILVILPDQNKGGPPSGYGGYGGPAQPGTWPPPPQSNLPPTSPPAPSQPLSGSDL